MADEKVIKLAMYPGEMPVVMSCGDLKFEIGYTAMHAIVGELTSVNQSVQGPHTLSHWLRFKKAMRLLEKVAMDGCQPTTPEQDAESMKRYHETGTGCIEDEF